MPADRTYEAGPSRNARHNANGRGGSHPKSYRKPKPAREEGSIPGGPKVHALEHRSADGVPGLSKLKAAIRQTTRLLKRDNLDPALRVQTQRRLESLQADLSKAEKRDVEKKNGARYHMVKFFDRQKLNRIIKREQRAIDKQDESTPSAPSSGSEHQETLRQARVMFNYALHFPNTEKYISLFPPDDTPTNDASQPKRPLPTHLSAPPADISSADKTTRRRLEVLREIEGLMRDGKLSAQPEVDHKEGKDRDDKVDIGRTVGGDAKDEGMGEEGEAQSASKDFIENSKQEKRDKKDKKDKKTQVKAEAAPAAVEDDDDFFEAD